jgi:hypothetical protein
VNAATRKEKPMEALSRWISLGLSVSAILLSPSIVHADETTTTYRGPTTSLQSEYLMTLYVPLEPHIVDETLRAVNHPGGWVQGPRIKGKIVPPSGDWLKTTANGLNRLDVRLTVQTDDDAIIYVSYNGISQCDPKRQLLRVGDCYFITAPTFETQSERYAWLNGIQAIGKMIELKRGDDGHLMYDIFLIK